jgi:hypothetical protein
LPYNLSLVKDPRKYTEKDVGENVFLRNIRKDCKVYLFYYPETIPNQTLEERLRHLGKRLGKNLFVNIGMGDDPDFDKIASAFEINAFPAVVITALDELASVQRNGKTSTVYIRKHVTLDDKHLTDSLDLTVKSIEEIYLLFMRGEIKKAMQEAANAKKNAFIAHLKKIVGDVLGKLGKFLWEKDISISVLEGKFELKSSEATGG